MQQKNIVMSWPKLTQAGLIALLYFLITQISLLFVVQPEGIAVIWPASGLLLAALLLNSKQIWPTLLAAVFLAIILANLLAGNSLANSLGFALAHCSESLLAAYLLTHFLSGPRTLTNLREVLGLVGLAAVLSNALTALFGAAVVSLASGASFWSAWQLWWVADGVGMLTITPVILTWAASPLTWKSFSLLRVGEAISLFVLLAITTQFIFGSNLENDIFLRPLPYMTIPFLVWATLRFGPPVPMTALLSLSLIAAWNAAQGRGPFADGDDFLNEHVLGAQLFLSLMALSSLVLMAVIAEGKRTRMALHHATGELERRVEERTAELAKANLALRTEVTERGRVEEELRAGEERFRQVILSISDHIYVTEITEDGRFVNRYLSPHVETLTGYPHEKFMNDWHFWSETVLHPADRLLAAQQAARLARGQNSEMEYRLVRANGQVIWVRDSARVRRLDTGMQIYGVISDITARKQTEEKLQQSEAQYRSLFEDSPISLWVEDFSAVKALLDRLRSEGVTNFETYFETHPETVAACASLVRIVEVNKATLELYGAHSQEELSDLSWILKSDSYDTFRQELISLAEGRTEYEVETLNYTLAGHRKHVNLRWSVSPGDEETLLRVIISIIDISERKRAEEELQKYKEYLEELVAERTTELVAANEQLEQEIADRERAEAALQATLIKTEALYRIGQAVVLSESLPDLLQVVVDSVVEAVPANRAVLITFDLNRQEVVHFIKSGAGSDQIVTVAFDELWQGLSGWVLRERQAALSPKGRPDERESLPVQQRRSETNCGAIMVVPLLYRGNMLGTLTAINRPEERDFTPTDADLLAALANQAVIILEHKLGEEALRESEERFRRLSDATFEGLVIHDKGQILDANHAATTMFGYELAEVIGRNVLDFVVPECHDLILQYIQSGYEKSYEIIGVKKDGETFPVEIWGKAIPYQGRMVRVAALRDISERKRIEEQLRFQKTLLECQSEASIDGILVVSDKREWLLFNQRFVEMWGLPEEVVKTKARHAALQMTMEQLVDPQRFLARIEYLYEHRDEVSWDEIVLKDGRTFERYTAPVKSTDRIYYGRVWYYHDISARKRAEEALQQSEAFLRSLFECAPDTIIVVNHQGTILRVNPQVETTFGYTSEELLGQSLEILLPERFRERHITHRLAYGADFRTRPMGAGLELFGRRKDGSEFPVDIMLSPLGAAEEGMVIAVVRDITERKRAVEALRESEQRIFQIMEAMPIGVYVIDAGGKPYYANRVSQQLLGKGIIPDIEVGQIADVYQAYVAGTDQLYPAERAPIVRALSGENSTIDDVEIHQPGQTIALEVSATPIFDANETIVYAIAVFQDITRRKQSERALQQAHRELARKAADLEAANAELSQYASIVSHDLRTPLRAIHNYADFLREDLEASLSGDQKAYLDGLGRAVREAEELIEALLQLARTGQQSVSTEPIDLGAFLPALLVSLRLPAEAEVIVADHWPTVMAEPILLRQVLQNLILNGLKFNRSPAKRIELGWRPAGAAGYELFVRDNGIGIARRYQEQIFRPFQRLHTRYEYEGTGIGLAIVAKAVQKLRGSIRVESNPGQGSTFFVILPSPSMEV